MKNQWLKDAVMSYLESHKNVDSVELVSYFKLRADITLAAINDLEEENKVEKYWNGRYNVICINDHLGDEI